MKLQNIIRKAQIASQLGSLAAGVVLKGHDQQKNQEIANKANQVFEMIYLLSNDDDR